MSPSHVFSISPPDALREGTAQQHRALEQLPLFSALLMDQVTLDDYQKALQVLYRFYASVEPVLIPLLSDHLPYVARLPLLQQDLTTLQIPWPIDIVQAPIIPNAAAAWGYRYVIEGSTLGGKWISRHLQHHLGSSITNALHFYTLNHDDHLSWKQIQAELTRHLSATTDLEHAIEHAKQCFDLLYALARDN